MNTFLDYYIRYPNLILDILKYFEIKESAQFLNEDICVSNFCISQGTDENDYIKIPSNIAIKICEILNENGILIKTHEGHEGLDDQYIFLNDNNISLDLGTSFSNYVNSIVYGFRYIYKLYSSIVIPIIHEDKNGSYQCGTGFYFRDGIATARHCIEGAKSIAIKNFSASDLSGKEVYVNQNPNIDVAYICTDCCKQIVDSREAEIMDSILVMGYPQIPGFTDFLTAEKGTVSSKAELRITPTVGDVVSIKDSFLARTTVLLITAKIRGGNSGGPIIGADGKVVGVACHIPYFEGNYDDLGYGAAIPISDLIETIENKEVMDVSQIEFKDFIE